jgi:hypothetical protein
VVRRGRGEERSMSIELDSLIRKGKDLEVQITHLTTELARLREEIASRMGETREYYGGGVVAKKWARVRWEIHKELLLDELSPEALDYFKEVVLTKEKLDQAIKAGHLPPRLYDRAVRREHVGWNVSLKVLDAPTDDVTWEEEEE